MYTDTIEKAVLVYNVVTIGLQIKKTIPFIKRGNKIKNTEIALKMVWDRSAKSGFKLYKLVLCEKQRA